MLHFDEIQRHLQFMVLTRVEDVTGIDRSTLDRFRKGVTRDPSHKVVSELSKFILGLRNDG